MGVTLWEMLTGQTPFRGSPTEVMDLHQREPLPLEQVETFPQPVVALLEVLLEKDPARRLQSSADLLKALAKVTDAIKVRRSIARQSLREIVDKQLGASGKAIEILTNFRNAIAAREVRLNSDNPHVLLRGSECNVLFQAAYGETFLGFGTRPSKA